MHAASLNATETTFATATAAARAARAEAEAKEAAAAATAAGIATTAAEARQRVEAAEMNAREHTHRAGAMEKRAIAATEQTQPQENVSEVSVTAATLLARAEEAERAVDEQKRQQAVRMVRTRCHVLKIGSVEPTGFGDWRQIERWYDAYFYFWDLCEVLVEYALLKGKT